MNLLSLLVFIKVGLTIADQAELTKAIRKQLRTLQALRTSLLQGCSEEKAYVSAAIAVSTDAAASLSEDLVALEAQHTSAQANATVIPESLGLAEVRVAAVEAAAEPLAIFRELYARRRFREAAEQSWLAALNRTCTAAVSQVQATELFVAHGTVAKAQRVGSEQNPEPVETIRSPEDNTRRKVSASLMQFNAGVRDVNWTDAILRGCKGLGMMDVGVVSQREIADEWHLLSSRTKATLLVVHERLKTNEDQEEQARGHSGAQPFQVFARSGSRWPGATKLHEFSAETAAAIDALKSAEAKALSLRADEAQASRRGASVLSAAFAAHQQRAADSTVEFKRREKDFEKEKAFCANRPADAGTPEHVPLAIFTTKSKVARKVFEPPLDTRTPKEMTPRIPKSKELKSSTPTVPEVNVASATPSAPPLKESSPEVAKVNVAPTTKPSYKQILQASAPEVPKVNVAAVTPPSYTQIPKASTPEAPKVSVAPESSENSMSAKPSLNLETTDKAHSADFPGPNKIVAPEPSSKKVTTALPQESQSTDAGPEVKPDLSKAPSLNSYLFGDSDGGGDSELSSLISRVHEMEQAPVRPVVSHLDTTPQISSPAQTPETAHETPSPVQTPEWAKPMAGDPNSLRLSASLVEEPNPYAADSYTNDPNVLKTLRLGRFASDNEIKSHAKVLASQEWAATEMSDSNSALTGFLEGASGGGVRVKPMPVVPHKKKSRKAIIKEDMSALDKIMGKLR